MPAESQPFVTSSRRLPVPGSGRARDEPWGDLRPFGPARLSHALALGESPRIHVLSITDNPAGNAMLAPTPSAPSCAHTGKK